MNSERSLHLARTVIVVGGLALLLMLTLRWWNASAAFTGFTVDGGTPGRAGIGIVAVVCTALLLVSVFVRWSALKGVRVLLALGALAAVVASAVTGSATATQNGNVVAESATLSWPAYAALALAAALVAATVVELFVSLPARLALPPLARLRPPAAR